MDGGTRVNFSRKPVLYLPKNSVPGDVPAEMAKELHCIDVNVIAYSICNDRQHYNGELSPGMMCAGVDGVGGRTADQKYS